MVKCAHCRDRKGKRKCPHLSGMICTACCGENRRTVFPCPADCPYLHTGESYRRQRAAPQVREKFTGRYAGYLRAGKDSLVRDLFEIERILYLGAAKAGKGDDGEIMEAVTFLRRSMSSLATVENFPGLLGRHLVDEVKKFAGDDSPGRRDEIREAADQLIRFLNSVSKCEGGDRDYIDLLHLAGHDMGFEKPVGPAKRASRIILPGEL